MTKILKILARSLGIILEWLVFLLILILFLVRSSTVQTFLAQKATSYFSKEWKTNVKIDRISIIWLDEIVLDGVYLEDQQGDTLVNVGSLFVNIESINPNKSIFVIDEITLENGNVKVNRANPDGAYNYAFISDYFKSSSPKQQTELDLLIRKVRLTNVNLKYDDFRKEYSDYGIDFDHIYAQNVNLEIDNLHVLDEDVFMKVKNLNFKEQSGFSAEKFSAKIAISGKGLKFDDLIVKTKDSDIKAKRLYLLMNSFDAFATVEDSVRFDVLLNKSDVNLKDVSYFASALEGMDQQVLIEGKLTQYIKNLKISDLYFKTGEKTIIKGNLQLPDFRQLKTTDFNEDLKYAYVDFDDLKNIKMPKSSGMKYLELPSNIMELGHIETSNLNLSGNYNNFTVRSNIIKTDIGSLKMANGIQFNAVPGSKDAYYFSGLGGNEYDLVVSNFQLGKFLDQSDIGILDAAVNLNGSFNNGEPISFSKLEGRVNTFGYNNYNYSNITVQNGSFENEVFKADLKANDPNLKVDFSGGIDLKGRQNIDFDMDLAFINLTKLNFVDAENTTLRGQLVGNVSGLSKNDITGEMHLENVNYTSLQDSLFLPTMDIFISKKDGNTLLDIESEIIAATLNGKINFATIGDEIIYEISKAFPAIVKAPNIKDITKSTNNFVYAINIKQPDKILPLFVKDLSIKNNTTIGGSYVAKDGYFQMLVNTDFIHYKNFYINNFSYDQELKNGLVDVEINTRNVRLNDTIALDSLKLTAIGNQDNIESILSWDRGTENESVIKWDSQVISLDELKFIIQPSYFGVNGKKWTVNSSSNIYIKSDRIQVENFKLNQGTSLLSLDGVVSKNDSDKLIFKLIDFKIDELSLLLGLGIDIKGIVNGRGSISNPYTNLSYDGDINIGNLYINSEEVGSVSFQSQWNENVKKVDLSGTLDFRGNETFTFDGAYDLSKSENNLDFDLNFEGTDISFTNAFLDPEIVSDIDGQLRGKIKIKGSPTNPKVTGTVDIQNGQARLALLGALFKFNGDVEADQDAFYINRMPLIDEEGNVGTVGGTILHNNFADWNFDISIDLEYDGRYLFKPIYPKPKLNRFLVMDTKNKEGSLYYGKAYVTGSANISGYADQLYIEVRAKTEQGTKMNIPLYGFTDYGDEIAFLTFKPDSNNIQVQKPKYNFTGIDLKLHFDVTPEAQLTVSLDDAGNEITSTGFSTLDIGVDNLQEVKMEGTYTVATGDYYFVLPPIKEHFTIEPGGTITWSGDPTNAKINLTAKYTVNASFADISPDGGVYSSSQQEVQALIYLTNTLLEPGIRFDIVAPNASEANQQLLARVKSDPDELNKQFFSLVLFKKFQPLVGSINAGSNAALDLLSSQLNSALSSLSKDFKLKVALSNNNQTGQNSAEIGVQKSFLNNKLRISGNFGVENNPSAATQQSGVIDINIEYILNQTGSFRVVIFNESNTQAVFRDQTQGPYTQGVGLTYQEDFNKWRDFRLFQYFLNIFRSPNNKRHPLNEKNRRVLLPEYDNTILKPEEK